MQVSPQEGIVVDDTHQVYLLSEKITDKLIDLLE